jgi:hypothetical protein
MNWCVYLGMYAVRALLELFTALPKYAHEANYVGQICKLLQIKQETDRD